MEFEQLIERIETLKKTILLSTTIHTPSIPFNRFFYKNENPKNAKKDRNPFTFIPQ